MKDGNAAPRAMRAPRATLPSWLLVPNERQQCSEGFGSERIDGHLIQFAFAESDDQGEAYGQGQVDEIGKTLAGLGEATDVIVAELVHGRHKANRNDSNLLDFKKCSQQLLHGSQPL